MDGSKPAARASVFPRYTESGFWTGRVLPSCPAPTLRPPADRKDSPLGHSRFTDNPETSTESPPLALRIGDAVHEAQDGHLDAAADRGVTRVKPDEHRAVDERSG